MLLQPTYRFRTILIGLCSLGLIACSGPSQDSQTTAPSTPSTPLEPEETAQTPPPEVTLTDSCNLIESGYGPPGSVSIQVEEVVSGLEVPWGVAFLPNGDLLVTERPGRVRLVQNGQLQPSPVVTIPATAQGEGGLLGIALHPDFANNRLFYLYYTTDADGTLTNRVERWRLAEDNQSATADQIIVGDIPVATYHNGGRLRFGPDGMLYIGTGDARDPSTAQNPDSLAGKILRVTPEGDIPEDNPFPNSPAYIIGVRNTQGFDWPSESVMWISDHGPSGELGRRAHDEVNVARPGANLGWPEIYRCQSQENLERPVLTWAEAVPPGGAAIYTGEAIAEWQGDLILGTLGSRHLHRVSLSPSGELQQHEVYLQDAYGRLREVIMGPDGELYVTTSNCDGRGSCPADGDKVLRITQ
ncbi:MAG: PQQ-dependent sugar dehydrogenase [Synechococcales bacterium]|nr:PQQ-dependent sugar dehydrogenase [Synechococcales bacterium]